MLLLQIECHDKNRNNWFVRRAFKTLQSSLKSPRLKKKKKVRRELLEKYVYREDLQDIFNNEKDLTVSSRNNSLDPLNTTFLYHKKKV